MKNKANNLLYGILIAISLHSSSCSARPRESQVTAGSPMSASIHFQFALYLSPGTAKDPQTTVREVVKRNYPSLELVETVPEKPLEMVVGARIQKNVDKEYPPPRIEELQYFGHGLSEEQAGRLQKSKQALILDFAHPSGQVWVALRAANQLVEQLARELDGFVWDEETREVFTPDAWEERRLASWTGVIPTIQKQTTIHAYKKDEFVRAISLGMKKAGLPDVVVEEFGWSSENQVGNLINIFCQAMVEGAPLDVPGPFTIDLKNIKDPVVRGSQLKSLKKNATGVGYLQLKTAVPDEGDPDNRLVELAFDRYVGRDPQAKRESLIGCFFGVEDKTTAIRHNEELLEASRKAKAQLPEWYSRFNAGLKPGELILVKAPFNTRTGGNEWMWVEISHWKNHSIRGILENDPELVPDLHAGEVVEVREEDVFDYIHKYPNGRMEGNTTGEIIQKMENESISPSPAVNLDELAKRIAGSDCNPNN
jgi:uncharacterized protein YegJ (DUF2314 family)